MWCDGVLVKLTCLKCGEPYDLPEGGEILKIVCRKCGTPQGSIFTYAKTVRFEAVEYPSYERACDAAREARWEPALEALEEAFRNGFDDFERVDHDPALAGLRRDPRFAVLVKKYRKR